MRLTLAQAREAEGLALGETDWRPVSQERINLFAKATDDLQWIHTDPERAASGPFTSTIAHGYLTLALISDMFADLLEISDAEYVVNYGINKLRFTSAVPSGSEIRLRARLVGGEPRGNGALLTLDVQMELKGSERPAFVGEILFLAL